MKKILLILIPLVLLGMKFEKIEEIKPAKEEFKVKEIVYPSAQCAVATINNQTEMVKSEIAPYVHCSSCGYGAFLGEEGLERCTFCGIKKN